MDKVLNTMNIGPNFRKWVKVLYTNICCKIDNNGYLTAPVAIQRGVRQGCPLSALLYILIAETLGETIRQDLVLKGIKLPGKLDDVRISQYADDTTLFLYDPESLKRALEIISIYEQASGAKLNLDKTAAMVIGNTSKQKFHIDDFPLNWVIGTGIKTLGITFFNDYFHTQNFNWTIQINKLKNTLDAWKSRSLSFKGKSMVINAMALSKIWYLGTVIEPLRKALKKINSSIFNFFWSDKMELVSRDTIFLPFSKGGLGVLNPDRQIQALNLKAFGDIISPDPKDHWVYLAQYWIGRRIGLCHQGWRYLSHNNNRPHSETYPSFYNVFIKFVPLHLDLFTSTSLQTNIIYIFLQQAHYEKRNALNNQVIFELKGPKQWEYEILAKLPWEQGWLLSYQGYNPYYVQDSLWKLRHHIFLTGVRIHSTFRRLKSINSMGRNCKTCSVPETALHLFAECNIAKAVWKHFLPALKKVLPKNTLFIQPHIMLGLFHNPNSPQADLPYRLAVTLVSTIVHSLWIARNEQRFNNIPPNSSQIIKSITCQISDILHHNFNSLKNKHRLGLFKHRFTIKKAFCKISKNKELIITI